MSQELQLGQSIDGRYRILDVLGDGQSGITYRAERLKDRTIVALKVLSLQGVQNWKLVELFEREASVLQTLEHPSIPRYLESFIIDTDDDRHFFIAQTLAEGKTLAEWVSTGWRPTESEVRDLADQILNILQYLQRLNPPIVHRDIKPQNVIRREDGQIFLVDFGAVAHTYQNTMMRGSTVVGTFGYMAPEQFRSQAYPASDLYGLGATLLFILTRRSPAELPTTKLRLQFRDKLRVSEALCDWLEQLLEPNLKLRFANAGEALIALPKVSKSSKNPIKFSTSKFLGAILILFALPFLAFKLLSENKYAVLSIVGDKKAIYADIEMEKTSLNDYLNQGGRWFMTPQKRAELLPIAWQMRDWVLAEEWLKEGVDLSHTDANGSGLLHSAMQLNQHNLLAIKQLYRYDPKIDWNQVDRQKQTPLSIAKTEEVALFLLEKGADPNTLNSNGQPFSQAAIEKGWKQIMTRLITTKSIKNKNGRSVLLTPIYQGNLPLLKALVQSGQRLTHGDILTMEKRNVDFEKFQEGKVNWIIKASPNINLGDQYQNTFLHYAASRQDLKLLKQLLEAGANPNAVNIEGDTPLNDWSIIYNSNLEVGRLLLKAGTNVNLADKDGTTALHTAVIASNLPVVQLLISYGADPNLTDKKGNTAMDYAAYIPKGEVTNKPQIKQLLLNSAQ